MSFNDELKQSLRTPEIVQKEKEEREWRLALAGAEYTLVGIKRGLVECAKNAEYSMVNGVAKVRYICELPNCSHYLKMHKEIDSKNIKIWYHYNIDPSYIKDFNLDVAALKHLAEKEDIKIEIFIKGISDENLYPIPAKTSKAGVYGLFIRATANITF